MFFCAPEVLSSSRPRYEKSNDIFSMGILFATILGKISQFVSGKVHALLIALIASLSYENVTLSRAKHEDTIMNNQLISLYSLKML